MQEETDRNYAKSADKAVNGRHLGSLTDHLLSPLMEGTGRFIAGRLTAKIELLPGEFEVLTRPARRGLRSGQLVLTNQRFIWRPSFKPKAEVGDLLLIEHERIIACDQVRPWQRLFLRRGLRLRLRGGEAVLLLVRHPETLLPVAREYIARERYRPGELFKGER